MEQALQGEHSETVIGMGKRSYQVLANPVKIYGKTQGAVILIWDVTEKNGGGADAPGNFPPMFPMN